MKTARIPAEITTIEDKITSKLSLSQLLLLGAPLFGGSIIFLMLPPMSEFSPYKGFLILFLSVVSCSLAIRVKERILLFWVVIIWRYNRRPRYHVLNKNDPYLRNIIKTTPKENPAEAETDAAEEPIPLARVSVADAVQLESIMANPKAKVHFRASRRGGLRVHITEIK